jgi:hypothetical protein
LDIYYVAGTLPGAILNVAGDAGVVKTQIQQQRTYSYKALDDAAKALIPLLTSASGGLDHTRLTQLRNCLSVVGLPKDILIVDFLYGGEFIVERSKALTCMRSLPLSTTAATTPPNVTHRRPKTPAGLAVTLDAGKLTDELEAVLKDPSTGLATRERVAKVMACYPPSLSKTVLPDQLLTNRSRFAKEKKAIIDCMQHT